jgi:hypothetical protein
VLKGGVVLMDGVQIVKLAEFAACWAVDVQWLLVSVDGGIAM